MIRATVIAGLLAACAAASARADDPAAVVEKFLRDDEKALLAAVRTDKAASAEFDADVKAAGVDAKAMKLVLVKWRGRLAAFAESDANHPNPDLGGTYRDYGAMLSPQIRAYLLRRLKAMGEDDRNSLISYLDSVNSSLADDGKLSWYTKRVAAGIMDKYRGELTAYLGTALAREGKAGAPAAERALAALHRSSAKLRKNPDVSLPDPAPAAPIPTTPNPMPAVAAPAAGAVADPAATADPTGDALEQARRAAEAAELSGLDFDGARRAGSAAGGVASGANNGGPDVSRSGSATSGSGLTPTPAQAKPSLAVEPPSPGGNDDFISSVDKMKTGSGRFQPHRYLPGATGALAGAAIGFLASGPLGALLGALLGLVAGALIGRQIFQ